VRMADLLFAMPKNCWTPVDRNRTVRLQVSEGECVIGGSGDIGSIKAPLIGDRLDTSGFALARAWRCARQGLVPGVDGDGRGACAQEAKVMIAATGDGDRLVRSNGT